MAKNLALIILLILAIGAGYAAWRSQNQIERREARAAELQESLADLEAENSELESSLSAAKAELSEARAALDREVSDLQSALAEKDERIASLRERIESLQSQVASVREEKTASLESAKENYESQIAALQETLAGKDQTIKTLNAKLEQLQATVSTAREKLGQLRGEPEAAGSEAPASGEAEAGGSETVPLAFETRSEGLFGAKRVVKVSNEADSRLRLTVAHARSGAEQGEDKQITLPANGSIELGNDWRLRPGDRLTFSHSAYQPTEYTVP